MARARRVQPSQLHATMPIEVDPAFVRVFADQSLVMHLGRDIDISFLAVGSRLERVQRGKEDTDLVKMRPQLNEVARVRLNPNGAALLAMEVLQGLIRSGAADKQAMIAAIEAIDEPEQSEAASDDTEATAKSAPETLDSNDDA